MKKKPVPWKPSMPLTVVPKDSHRSPNHTNPSHDRTGIPVSKPFHVRRRPPGTNPSRGKNGTQPELPDPTVQPARAAASVPLLKLLGHGESCARLRRRGRILSCDCPVKPMDDPAVTIGLVIHFARLSLAGRCALPDVIVELLAARVEEGDAASIVVAEWLDASGLLELKPLPHSKRRSR